MGFSATITNVYLFVYSSVLKTTFIFHFATLKLFSLLVRCTAFGSGAASFIWGIFHKDSLTSITVLKSIVKWTMELFPSQKQIPFHNIIKYLIIFMIVQLTIAIFQTQTNPSQSEHKHSKKVWSLW